MLWLSKPRLLSENRRLSLKTSLDLNLIVGLGHHIFPDLVSAMFTP